MLMLLSREEQNLWTFFNSSSPKISGYFVAWKRANKLTLRACMATWGTLLLTLFIMDFKLSFGLKGEKNRIEHNALGTTVQKEKTQVLQSILRFYYIKLGGVSTKAMLLWVHKGIFKPYPLGFVPILSQMSIMSPQSSVVLVSFVAFSENFSNRNTVNMAQ